MYCYLNPISFRKSCHFYLSKVSLIFLLISLLSHWIFGSVLFNFHVFMSFPNLVILLISNSPLWGLGDGGCGGVNRKMSRHIYYKAKWERCHEEAFANAGEERVWFGGWLHGKRSLSFPHEEQWQRTNTAHWCSPQRSLNSGWRRSFSNF